MSIKDKILKQVFGFDEAEKPRDVVSLVITGLLTFYRARAQEKEEDATATGGIC